MNKNPSPFLKEITDPSNVIGMHTRNLINIVEECEALGELSLKESQMVEVGFYLTLLVLDVAGHDMEALRKQFLEGTFFHNV